MIVLINEICVIVSAITARLVCQKMFNFLEMILVLMHLLSHILESAMNLLLWCTSVSSVSMKSMFDNNIDGNRFI